MPSHNGVKRYSALVKYTKHFSLLLASILLASVAFGLTEDSPSANNGAVANQVAAAHSKYVEAPGNVHDNNQGTTLAQFSRRASGPPFPPYRRYPGQYGYQQNWVDHSNAGPVLLGAAIGFGIGGALGASQSIRNHTPVAGGVIIAGGLFGLMGAAVGKAVGDLHGGYGFLARHKRIDPPPGPEVEDKEADVSAESRNSPSQETQQARSIPAHLALQPVGVHAVVMSSSSTGGTP